MTSHEVLYVIISYLLGSIPCGFIINELVTNSFKYAFPEGRAGTVFVRLQEIDRSHISMIIGDDGIGLPETIEFENADTLGLRLVRLLALNQLDGSIDIAREQGTIFTIKVKRRSSNG